MFTELLDFVEQRVGVVGLEETLTLSGLDGVYTSTGNYPHTDAIKLLITLSEKLNLDIQTLMRQYGNELFPQLVTNYPMFFENNQNTITFLTGIQSHIHDVVKSLYPDTAPPEFEINRQEQTIEVTYRSHRPFAALAHGMIEACIKHFGEDLKVEWTVNPAQKDNHAIFVVSPK